MERDYPTLSLTQLQKLKTVLDTAADDPKFLDGRICPYDKSTRDILKSLIANPVIAATLNDSAPQGRQKAGAKKKTPNPRIAALDIEFKELREEIKSLKADAAGLEPHDRIQIVKTRAALVEKMLTMEERISNLKEMEKFTAAVIRVMEDELPQEYRIKVLDALEPLAEKEG